MGRSRFVLHFGWVSGHVVGNLCVLPAQGVEGHNHELEHKVKLGATTAPWNANTNKGSKPKQLGIRNRNTSHHTLITYILYLFKYFRDGRHAHKNGGGSAHGKEAARQQHIREHIPSFFRSIS